MTHLWQLLFSPNRRRSVQGSQGFGAGVRHFLFKRKDTKRIQSCLFHKQYSSQLSVLPKYLFMQCITTVSQVSVSPSPHNPPPTHTCSDKCWIIKMYFLCWTKLKKQAGLKYVPKNVICFHIWVVFTCTNACKCITCACVWRISRMLLTCQNLSGRTRIANQYPQTRHHSFNHQFFLLLTVQSLSFQWAVTHPRDQVDNTCMWEKGVLVNLSNMQTLLHLFQTCARNILSPVDMFIVLEHTFRRNGASG